MMKRDASFLPLFSKASLFIAGSSCWLLAACGGDAAPLPNHPGGMHGGGPLGGLHASRAQRATFTFEGGRRADVLLFDAEHVHVSASCARPTGELQCQAMDALRGGKTIQLAGNELNGGANPGAIACRKMGRTNTTGRGPGGEDGFCEFPDGSFVSTGALEFHVGK